MIEVTDLRKSYGRQGKTLAIDGISFTAGEGEIFGVIGPDGAGKSTLFRILASLILPDSGKALLNGHDVVNDYRKIRQIIGYMPERFSLYQDLSVEENLQFFATLFHTTIEENYHLISDIYRQIEPFKKRRAGALSGGMKQKLALSCALIHKPEILILDDSASALDYATDAALRKALAALPGALTVFIVSQRAASLQHADQILVLDDGHLVGIGTHSALRSSCPVYEEIYESQFKKGEAEA